MKHPDPRLRAYCDLVVAEPTSVTAVRDPDDGLGRARRGCARGGRRSCAELGAGRGGRRGVGRRQPGHPARARARPPGDAARGHGDEVPVPGAGRAAASARRARSSTPGPRSTPAARAATASRSRSPARSRRRRSRPSSCCPLVAPGGAAILWTGAAGRRRRAGGAPRRSWGAPSRPSHERRRPLGASWSFGRPGRLRSGFRAVPGSLVRVRFVPVPSSSA